MAVIDKNDGHLVDLTNGCTINRSKDGIDINSELGYIHLFDTLEEATKVSKTMIDKANEIYTTCGWTVSENRTNQTGSRYIRFQKDGTDNQYHVAIDTQIFCKSDFSS